MTDDDITLPPLPLPDHAGPNGTGTYFSAWTETQVRDAQRAAVLLDRQQRAAPSAAPVAWQPALSYPGDEKQRVWANGKPRPQDVEYWTKNGNGVIYAYTTPPDHTALLQQALEALEERYIGALRDNAIDALRATLEETK